MPATITANPDLYYATIDVPVDGDLADMLSLLGLSNLFDFVYFILKRIQHPVQPGAVIYGRADGTDLLGAADTRKIKIKPLSGVVLIDTAVRFISTGVEVEIGEAQLEFGGQFQPSTHYHVYVWFNNAVFFEISVTPPDVSRLFKQGGTTHRYLFSFLTDGAGPPANVFKFTQDRDRHIRWRELGVALGSPVAAQDVAMAGYIPQHVRTVIVRSTVSDSAGAVGNVRIGPKGADIAGGTEGRLIRCSANAQNSEVYPLALSEDQKFTHMVNAATTTHELTILGYEA